MSHFSENVKRLDVKEIHIANKAELLNKASGIQDVCIIRLPSAKSDNDCDSPINDIGALIEKVAEKLGDKATLVILGETIDLVQVQAKKSALIQFQLWVAIKRNSIKFLSDKYRLPNQHFGALVFTRYKASLRHTKTRLEYTYCPICEKTTKDYGGKKHTYHEYGTLLSDVWRDISCDLDGNISIVIERFADLFGLEPYNELIFLDCLECNFPREARTIKYFDFEQNELKPDKLNKIINGDCIEELKKLPSDTIDFAFVDPPYNLKKKYAGYSDDMNIQDYFKWCDEWIVELTRVLKPGRTLALLNIPLWAVRHFLFAQTILEFQNWIVWDALAFPVRMIMPSHYTILCFSKGVPRELPGLNGKSKFIKLSSAPKVFNALVSVPVI